MDMMLANNYTTLITLYRETGTGGITAPASSLNELTFSPNPSTGQSAAGYTRMSVCDVNS